MKGKMLLAGVLSTLLILSVAVYAYEIDKSGVEGRMMNMMDEKELDNMHELITEGPEPEMEAQMDEMHEECKSQFGKKEESRNYMRNIGMNGMSEISSMMKNIAGMVMMG